MDTFAPEQRSAIMRAVKGADTRPEMVVRRLVHRLGYRYRLHVRALPGAPDLVFPARHKVIFVHGCFWHRHACKEGRSTPASRIEYWSEKFRRNQRRDYQNRRRLRKLGWQVLVVWECQTLARHSERLEKRLREFLAGNSWRSNAPRTKK